MSARDPPLERVRVWDAPVRLFHWALAAMVIFSFVTGKIGGDWMAWHMKSGYAILALLLFRLAWGVIGSQSARFTSFVRGPRAAVEYVKSIAARRRAVSLGHDPLGGWSVLFMLAVLLFQAGTGLFVNDEIATQGPLTVKVSNAVVEKLTSWHHYNQWVIVAAVVLHLAAVATYQWGLKVDLIGAMVHGDMMAPASTPAPSRVSPLLAAVLLGAACAFVYWLVVIFPKAPT